ncbi:hypothetical protein SAMN05444407_10334 [Chryseobacterium contaminans]|uniref:DUF721 domain-containing protein n=2 Tax=Chryseobacterium contaminans TaxID=1423959 RepID=A0A1M6Z067_9FLAO|nr:hypothetical protein SAMN05444407_10334 [Chryseobacterium contaminans]
MKRASFLTYNSEPLMKKKKREYQSSELVKSFARIYGFEDKLVAFDIKDFLEDYLDQSLFNEIRSVNIENKCIIIKIDSPLLKNDFKMRKNFYLKKFQDKFGEDKFDDLKIL